MSYPPDHRVLSLLSAFDDSSSIEDSRYDPESSCHQQRYVRHARAGDLVVTVLSHSGTTWATLEGLLDRRACRSLADVLMRTDAPDVVLNVADLELPAPSGGTPLITLCATLSCAGYSVTAIGSHDEASSLGGDPYGHQTRLLEIVQQSA